MTAPAIWLTEHDVAASLGITEAIDAVRAAFQALGFGRARTMTKAHTAWPTPDGTRPATLHALGGAVPEQGLAGTKTWVHTPQGSQPLLVLFDAATGRVRAVVEAFTLGQLRTAAVSGLATDLFAPADASTLAMVGTGRQALPQVAAVAAVRPLAEVRVVGRDRSRAAALAERIDEVLGLPAVAPGSVAAAVEGADVVTLATRATEPVLSSAAVSDGAHVNAIGAITPERVEFEPDLLERCRVLCADSVEDVRANSGEFRAALGSDPARWDAVRALADVVAYGVPPQARTGPSLFKAMGTGLADVAVAERCVGEAVAAGRGLPLPDRPAEPEPLLAPFRGAARMPGGA